MTCAPLATEPNGYTQASMNRMKPNHTGIRASLAAKLFCSAADLMERALMFQYAPRKTQHASIRIPFIMATIVSPSDSHGE